MHLGLSSWLHVIANLFRWRNDYATLVYGELSHGVTGLGPIGN